jgi:RimJ/RimL family protein N-acetyltransferase
MILVDPCRWPHRGDLWCHMVSDTNVVELHAFARQLGIPRVAFQGDHYDLPERVRAQAVALGATQVRAREIVRALDVAGLRRGPAYERRGLDGVTNLDAPSLTTDRLMLRQWHNDDREAFAAMSAHEDTARWLGGALSRKEADAFIDRYAVLLALRGFGMWAVEETQTKQLVGSVGLSGVRSAFAFAPALEVAWRLDPKFRGAGYATEAAAAALQYAHGQLNVERVAAFTSIGNVASQNVMKRLGMLHDESLPNGEFDHPLLPADHVLKRHVLFWWDAHSRPPSTS